MVTKYRAAVDRYNVTLVNEPTQAFYVYRYSIGTKPFYVGVGKGDRFLAHLVQRSSSPMNRMLAKLERERISFSIKIVFHTDSRKRALLKEKELVAKYGRRKDGGSLVNITIGGDGGDTYLGRKMYYHPKTEQVKIFVEGTQPRGWKRGRPPNQSIRGYLTVYSPKTNLVRRIPPNEKIPSGFILGRPKLGNTGPKGKIVLSNPETGEHRWVKPDVPIPKGWIHGRSHVGSTKDKIGWHNPKTGEKKYLALGIKPPKGWIKGIKPTTGFPVKVGKLKFDCVQKAVDHFGTSRYLLMKRPDFQFME